ncbi:MAG: MauE/DoxX family redox-associated membrane protein [Candidatus Omnitrophota bacterium]
MMREYAFLLLRFVLASVFIASGWEKAVSPSENFLYILQAYEVLPSVLERLVSVVFPWVELAVGVSLLVGLWLRAGLLAATCVSGSFILIVGQAIIRRLPIDNCGCFGNLVHLPLRGVIFLDLALLTTAWILSSNLAATSFFSLDRAAETRS